MAAWDDVIDFDNVGEWPMELSGWLGSVRQNWVEHRSSFGRRCFSRSSRIRTAIRL